MSLSNTKPPYIELAFAHLNAVAFSSFQLFPNVPFDPQLAGYICALTPFSSLHVYYGVLQDQNIQLIYMYSTCNIYIYIYIYIYIEREREREREKVTVDSLRRFASLASIVMQPLVCVSLFV